MDKLLDIKTRYNLMKNHLNEKSKRLWCAAEAKVLKHGGIALVHSATKIARGTITTGIKELELSLESPKLGNIRKKGGGRKKAVDKTPEIKKALLALIEPSLRGEPESPLLWTTKSLRNLSSELKEKSLNVSHVTIRQILKSNNFSLQANRKTNEGSNHTDRNEQFEHIYSEVIKFQAKNNPVISVDAKKKELIGNFKNNGQEWHKKASSPKVNAYDFLSNASGKITPYGVYDITKNTGWVNVGINKDTSEFAVNSIRNWWNKMGKKIYKNSKELMITADGGGSNGSRVRLWKLELQKLANETGLKITVSHLPPGTSKWNKIEHRLFSYISKNWRGKPLVSYEVAVNLIASTKTAKGLNVVCELDTNTYETGKKVTTEEFKQIKILRQDFHGEWNYKIIPQSKQVIS